jgi:hypothetical protein
MKTDTAADSHRICQPGTDSDDIEINPEFAELLPPPLMHLLCRSAAVTRYVT